MSRSGREDSHDDRLEFASSPLATRDTETNSSSRSGRGAGSDNHQYESPESEISSRSPERQRTQTLDESELRVLTDIGTFRALAVEDLARHRYGGHAAKARQGLRNLFHKGLIQSRTSYPERAVYVTLTRAGIDRIAAWTLAVRALDLMESAMVVTHQPDVYSEPNHTAMGLETAHAHLDRAAHLQQKTVRADPPLECQRHLRVQSKLNHHAVLEPKRARLKITLHAGTG